jgi:lysosomal alpha-mannosidase
MDRLYAPLTPLFSNAMSQSDAYNVKPSLSSALSLTLPINIQLVTLEYFDDSTLLVRLAHQYAVDESPSFSNEMKLDLFALLAQFHPVSAAEYTLSANQLKSEQIKNKIHWNTESVSSKKVISMGDKGYDDGATKEVFMITLEPMDIKTYLVKVNQ